MTVDLTQEQIDKARDRVKANKPLEKPQQTSKRPADANRQSGKPMTLADAYKQAADSVKEAQAKPTRTSMYPVDLSQNRSAGNTLMNYVRNHRILAWDDTLPDPANSNDRYYVQIVDF
ncbi:hypothetical protein HW130_13665 [Streptomyces sp. PKU-EA00015]|uniref:hypothetical protein n=1 Tax=Streptomyces sp. PKU-EA00015 TaxID=2748326 RepID=UPI0015A2C07B|nr:hypothetical protein [Streptomyces sp. PKU-EA00015]NWF27308.1 hypothetical protein [Streptomyces sp. PKU-EA00015]